MKQKNFRNIIAVLLILSFVDLYGCASFKKKFIRQPKNKAEEKVDDVIFIPEEYPEVKYSKEEIYSTQYLFWRNWHTELINFLTEDSSRKKQIDCASEALECLVVMKNLLRDEKQIELDKYIKELTDIKDSLLNDRMAQLSTLQRKAMSLQNKIQKGFSYNKVKDYLK